ncbi:MAG: glycosyltransferase [Anaerolineales bacterium]|nr:glycosyltransferase [Anaerolineales bacterium]
MRIGMMVDSYKPYISGITNYVEVNKKYLEEAGHEVFVFTFGDVEFQDDEPNIIRSPGLPIADTGFYLSMRYSREAKELLQTMDVVHVHHPFLSGRLALRYCRPKNIPIIFTNHTRYDLYAQAYLPLMPDEVSVGLLQSYMPPFCKAMDMVVTPSAGMAKVLRELKVESPVEIVPNGIDLSNFQAAKPLLRKNHGFKADDILIVYAGRIALEKNLPFLIESFSGVAKAIPSVRLLLIGGGVKQYEEDIREFIAEQDTAERIHMIGRVPYHELPSYVAMCDIFATASVTEVHPLSVIEAMGAGLPVMGIESVGVGDTVQDGITGYLSTEDLPAFTAKLTRLCLEPELRKQMSASARRESFAYAIERTTSLMAQKYTALAHGDIPRKRNLHSRLQEILEKFLS